MKYTIQMDWYSTNLCKTLYQPTRYYSQAFLFCLKMSVIIIIVLHIKIYFIIRTSFVIFQHAFHGKLNGFYPCHVTQLCLFDNFKTFFPFVGEILRFVLCLFLIYQGINNVLHVEECYPISFCS